MIARRKLTIRQRVLVLLLLGILGIVGMAGVIGYALHRTSSLLGEASSAGEIARGSERLRANQERFLRSPSQDHAQRTVTALDRLEVRIQRARERFGGLRRQEELIDEYRPRLARVIGLSLQLQSDLSRFQGASSRLMEDIRSRIIDRTRMLDVRDMMADRPVNVTHNALANSASVIIEQINRTELNIAKWFLSRPKATYMGHRNQIRGTIQKELEKIRYFLVAIEDEKLLSAAGKLHERVEELHKIHLTIEADRARRDTQLASLTPLGRELFGLNREESVAIQRQSRQTHDHVMMLSLIVGAAFLLPTLLIGWRLGRSIVHSLQSTVKVLHRVDLNRLDEPFGQTDGLGDIPDDEIGRLIRALDDMRRRLREGIAQREQAQRALQRNEQNLRITLNSIADGVIATDAQGRVTQMNPVAEQLTGWSHGEAEGRDVEEVYRLQLGDPDNDKAAAFDEEVWLIARDGTRRRVAASESPIVDEPGNQLGEVVVFQDISEEVQLQEQLRHAQKMEAVGQLAGGVAHDFNNLLTAIMGSAALLAMRLGEDHEEAGLVEQITLASGRAADLTKQLLAFSRKGRMQSTSVDLHEMVGEVHRLIARSIDRRIEIVCDLQADHPIVHGDPTQLQNALLNLCVNARDAMPQGGTLTLATHNVTLSREELEHWPEDLAPGEYVQVEVRDTGVGMDEALQTRIFEPFFTTKPEGEGTGLGLAGVYGCVQSHSGAIRVESDPGEGATFRLLLPASISRDRHLPRRRGEGVVRGEGTVLIIDDEEVVRKMLAKAVGELGYEVLTAVDGPDGIETFTRAHEEIDVVILDMVMPRLGGEETYHRLKQIDPDVPVLIASGYARNVAVDRLTQAGATGFLAKPFQLDELSRLLAQVGQPGTGGSAASGE